MKTVADPFLPTRAWTVALLCASLGSYGTSAAQILSPSISISSRIVSDGISSANPKAIPASVLEYEMLVSNVPSDLAVQRGPVIANPVPEQLSLFVGDIGTGSGPFAYEPASSGSGFDCKFESLSNPADCVEFSDNGGASFDYSPTPDREGFDPNITHIRFRLQPGIQPDRPQTSSFILRYRMRME
jgi:hypothetical protein